MKHRVKRRSPRFAEARPTTTPTASEPQHAQQWQAKGMKHHINQEATARHAGDLNKQRADPNQEAPLVPQSIFNRHSYGILQT